MDRCKGRFRVRQLLQSEGHVVARVSGQRRLPLLERVQTDETDIDENVGDGMDPRWCVHDGVRQRRVLWARVFHAEGCYSGHD